jgi:hypothetical protein
MIKAILISALTIPIIVFTLFAITGVVVLLSDLITSGKYSSSWLGLIYAGAGYSYLSLLISSIPTIVLGLPASLIAKKYGYLTKSVVITGAYILGCIFLSSALALFSTTASVQSILWFAFAGSIGGLVNGLVFWKYLKPNNRINPTLKDARTIT